MVSETIGTLIVLTVSPGLNVRVPLSVMLLLEAMEPVDPPLPICSVPVLMIVVPV